MTSLPLTHIDTAATASLEPGDQPLQTSYLATDWWQRCLFEYQKVEIEPSAEQDSLTTNRSGLDRRQRAQQHYEKSQVRLANILAYADKNASTPRSRYRLAQDHVRAEKNSEAVIQNYGKKNPDTPARRIVAKEKQLSEEIQGPVPKEKRTDPKMAEGLEKLIATMDDMNKRLEGFEV